MAVRPVFVVSLDNQYCIRENIEFEFFNGFSEKQKRRCINSLHQSYLKENPGKKFYSVISSQVCPDMKKVTLEKVAYVLEHLNEQTEIVLEDSIMERAKLPLEKMLQLASL